MTEVPLPSVEEFIEQIWVYEPVRRELRARPAEAKLLRLGFGSPTRIGKNAGALGGLGKGGQTWVY